MRLVFQSPSGQTIENPKLDMLQELIVSPPAGYWEQGSGGGNLNFLTNGLKASLMVFPDSRFGVYLRFYDEKESPWLSLQDETKLSEITECNDDWYVSIGLFLPKEEAWLAVREFCLTGNRSSEVRWMPASEIPEGGNW